MPSLTSKETNRYTHDMRITDDQLKEYIDFVKSTFNRDMDAHQAYEELYKLLTVVARCYLPPDIVRLLEISPEVRYTENAIHMTRK